MSANHTTDTPKAVRTNQMVAFCAKTVRDLEAAQARVERLAQSSKTQQGQEHLRAAWEALSVASKHLSALGS